MPNRVIKETILTSPCFNKLSTRAEVHFYRLLLGSNTSGKFHATALQIKARFYPGGGMGVKTINKLNRELVGFGFLKIIGEYGWVIPGGLATIGRQAIPDSLRRKIYERDNYKCRYCGSNKNLTIDHVHPYSKGGLDTEENLITACRRCNSVKGARPPKEVGMYIGEV